MKCFHTWTLAVQYLYHVRETSHVAQVILHASPQPHASISGYLHHNNFILLTLCLEWFPGAVVCEIWSKIIILIKTTTSGKTLALLWIPQLMLAIVRPLKKTILDEWQNSIVNIFKEIIEGFNDTVVDNEYIAKMTTSFVERLMSNMILISDNIHPLGHSHQISNWQGQNLQSYCMMHWDRNRSDPRYVSCVH